MEIQVKEVIYDFLKSLFYMYECSACMCVCVCVTFEHLVPVEATVKLLTVVGSHLVYQHFSLFACFCPNGK